MEVDKGKRVKITSIQFEGNNNVSDKKLRKKLKNTKQKKFLSLKPLNLSKKNEEDKYNLINYIILWDIEMLKLFLLNSRGPEGFDIKIKLEEESNIISQRYRILWEYCLFHRNIKNF